MLERGIVTFTPSYLAANRPVAARRQIEENISTASGVADTVRTGLESAFDDLRRALLEARNKLT